jgi:hypothetical protein
MSNQQQPLNIFSTTNYVINNDIQTQSNTTTGLSRLVNSIPSTISSTYEDVPADINLYRPSLDSSLLDSYYNGNYAATNFLAEQFTPSQMFSPIVDEPVNMMDTTFNLLKKHVQESKVIIDNAVPKLNTINVVKRLLRDFMGRQLLQTFEFLNSNITSIEPLSTARNIVKRFGNVNYNSKAVKVKDLCLDLSCNESIAIINEKLSANPATDISGCVAQWKLIVDTWKKAVADLGVAQTSLESKVLQYDEVQKRISYILLLPENDGYQGILDSTHEYLKKSFDGFRIEESYNLYLNSCKMIYVLQEFVSSFRHLVNAQTDPICSVCLTDSVAYATIPCGHTFCTICSHKQTVACYICRGAVREKIKIYFS